MENFNCDSYCGIYCGACDIMRTFKTGEKSRLAAFWDERTVKTFQHKLGIGYDDNRPFTYECHGCKSDMLFVNCAVCQIRQCAINSKVEHCIDCEKYPCNLIADSKKIEKILPHLKSNPGNMETIKRSGVSQWLSEQENKWKCPACGKSFSWYTRKCKNCGQDLKKVTFKYSFWKSALLKMSIKFSSGKQK